MSLLCTVLLMTTICQPVHTSFYSEYPTCKTCRMKFDIMLLEHDGITEYVFQNSLFTFFIIDAVTDVQLIHATYLHRCFLI